jgi:hypothetical protein
MEVFVADGKQLALEGKVDVQMQVGTHIFQVTALVAELQVEGILGLDVIKRFDMIIDTKHGSLTLQDEDIPITYEGKFGCFRVVAQETFSIPPRSELVVPGRICIENSNQLPSPGIIERNWKASDMKRPLTARTLVQPIENIVPVRLLNVDTEPKVVYRNSEIGQYLETETNREQQRK